MKTPIFLINLILFLSLNLSAQTGGFVNDICLPTKQYLLFGVQNDLFIQTFIKRWRPYNDFVRFGGTAKYERRYESVASIKFPETGQTILVELVNSDSFKVLKKLECVIVKAEPGKGSGEVTVQFLGDSFTKGNYFKSAFLEKGYVPNVKCVGLRKVDGVENQFHEGRGRWTLENYFSNKVENPNFFNPFLQPQGKMRYWGSTAFWKSVIAVDNNTVDGKSFEPSYSCGGYDCNGFDADGFRTNPANGDLMYDFAKKNYVTWNGKSWKIIAGDKVEWSFQYDKYLTMWNISAPRFLIVMLGLNDFRSKPMPLDFTKWNEQIELLLISYKKAVPNGRLVICTPCTSCGVLNNKAGDFIIRQNAVMWEVRRNIIQTFDKRETEGVFVVDASVTIDNKHGYRSRKEELPYVGYTGDESLTVQEGNPHPYLSYPSLGIPLAAFVQYFREK